MIVICAGMYRSGSTWQYLVAGELLDRIPGGRRLGYVGRDEFPALAPADAGPPRVLKSHEGHTVCAEWLAVGTAKCLYSYRDMRDVAFSMAHKQGMSVAELAARGRLKLCIANHEFWTGCPNVFVQRYEPWLADPAAAVTGIANHLDIPLAPGEAEAIAAKFSLDENRRRTVAIAGRFRADGIDLTDPANVNLPDADSQLHWNHIRQGIVGDWRERATPDEIAILAGECGGWLAEHGYEPDPVWQAAHRHAQAAEAAEFERDRATGLAAHLEMAHAEARDHVRQLETAQADAVRVGNAFASAQAQAARESADLAAETARLRAELRTAQASADREKARADRLARTLDHGLGCLPHRIARRFRTALRAGSPVS